VAAPVLDSFAQRLYDAMAPLADQDAALGYPLANYCKALGEMFQIVDDYARDQLVNGDWTPGWSQLLDLGRAPTEALAWLAQFVGVVVTTGISDAAQRAQISAVGGWRRGTKDSMLAALQATLTGTKTVVFRERDGDPYFLTITSKPAETPNFSASLAALLAQKPAGIVMDYHTLAGQDYSHLNSTYASYSLVFTTYSTYQQLLDDIVATAVRTFGSGTFGSGTFGG
jgi:hypothetical protein